MQLFHKEMTMQRYHYLQQIRKAFEVHPIVALLGPRQCGKTTIAKQYAEQDEKVPAKNYFDLEDPSHLTRLENPLLALEELTGLIVIDEIQRIPNLFSVLRVLIDRSIHNKKTQRYL